MKTERMNKPAIYLLTGLRVLVGWHFLYEGIAKLTTPEWSAKTYLMGSRWIFSDLFHAMAASPEIMKVVDFLNIWGLILIGVSLMLGLLVRWSAVAGALLLFFYFVSYPSLPGYTLGTVVEGSYLVVNKTLIEFLMMLAFLVLPAGSFYSVDRWIKRLREEKAHAPVPVEDEKAVSLGRRELLRDLMGVPFLGIFAYAAYKQKRWQSFEEKFLAGNTDAVTGATRKFYYSSLEDLKGEVPKGKIGDMELSRMIMGGNLIGGWAHARDLIYVSKLVKTYHTDERVMMTMALAEKCGINALLTNPVLSRIVNKYWHETGGKMQFISDCGGQDNLLDGVRVSEEANAAAMYCHGGISDQLVHNNNFDEIAKALELIRSYGKPAGIGAHRIETVKACVERGLIPDFWVKTLHHHHYWSAEVDPEQRTTVDKGYKDNMYCFKPQDTIDFMNNLEQPWIAFKILAAGAIKPQDGFRYAFEKGADFVCVGMYDFQIVEDVNIALDVLGSDGVKQRTRQWMA